MKKRFPDFTDTKEYWKKGGAEFLGFVMILPFIIILICAITSAAQIAIINETLTYCAYSACRSAVVCDNLSTAEDRADQTYELHFNLSNAVAHGYEPCELKVVGGTNWGKGAYVQCTVRYYITTLMPFTSGLREQYIVMMIENGDAGL